MRGVSRSGARGGPAIVFLHGGVINRHMWGPVIAHLESRYDCLAIDLPGHGDHRDVRFDMGLAVRGVLDTMDAAGIERAAQVGLSLGGYVAQAITAAAPSRVQGLVLSGATIHYQGWDGLSTKLYGWIFPLVSRLAARAFEKKMIDDLGPDLAGRILDGGLSMSGGGQALRRLPGTDYAAAMSGFQGPIVLANGERDTSNREGESRFTEMFPAATSVVIDDAGHACALQQPEAFAAAVDQLMTRVP